MSERCRIRFVDTAWDGLFAYLQVGKYDAVCSAVTITDERKKVMDFSRPYINAGQVIVVREGEFRPGSPADLKGKTCGAITGTTGAAILKEAGIDIKFREYDDYIYKELFNDLEKSAVDALILDMPVASNYCFHDKSFKGKFLISSPLLNEEYCGVAVLKGNRSVLNLINSGLNKVVEKGKYKELCIKWFGVDRPIPGSR